MTGNPLKRAASGTVSTGVRFVGPSRGSTIFKPSDGQKRACGNLREAACLTSCLAFLATTRISPGLEARSKAVPLQASLRSIVPGRKSAVAQQSRLRLRGLAGNVVRILALHRRALHRSVGTENTTVTRLRPKQSVTARALVKELARVDGHGFTLRETADRTN
jgi:hypothetical protein